MRVTIKQRLIILASMVIVALVSSSAYLMWSMNQVRIGSDLYNKIVLDKDLLADILPPPEYIIESNLTFYEFMDATSDSERAALIEKMQRLQKEHADRKAFWQTIDLPNQVREVLALSQEAGERFYQDFQSFIALIEKKDSLAYQSMKASLIEHYRVHRAHIDELVGLSVAMFEQHESKGQALTQELVLIAQIGLSIMIIGGLAFVIWIGLSILRPIDAARKIMAQVETTGNFSFRVPVSGKDEIAQMSQSFNSLLGSLQGAIEQTNGVLDKIADGQFSARIRLDLEGDLGQLVTGVNRSADAINFMMDELAKIMNALREGDFKARMDTRVAEDFRTQVDNAMQRIDFTLDAIGTVMQGLSQGDFNQRVEVAAQGQLAQLKDQINHSMQQLGAAVSEINAVMAQQAQGDLTQLVKGIYAGQLETLKAAVNTSAQQLRKTLLNIHNVSNRVATSAVEFSDASNDLSQRTQQMAASLEETAASMEEMTATVRQNTDSAQQANQLAAAARKEASQGAQVASQAIDAMRVITESSNKIGEIIVLIDGIAFQTNLLALNAAVEAARAGEHGRGFAVVAGEVRALAQKSAEASREIKALIESSSEQVESGSGFVAQTGQSLDSINQAIKKVSDIVSEIAAASLEQAQGVQQVNTAIMNLDNVTQQNAALVEETSASASSLSEQADDLNSSMSQFRVS